MERTVKEVLPALIINRDQMMKVVEALNKQVATKGQEINDYKEKNNIRIRNRDEITMGPTEAETKAPPSQGVLVDGKA